MKHVGRALLLLAVLGSVATSPEEQVELRLPCDGSEEWASALVLRWVGHGRLPVDAPAFRDAIRLEDEQGRSWSLDLVLQDPTTLVLCPTEGLPGSTWFTWKVGPFNESPSNGTPIPDFRQTGTWAFRTTLAGVPPMSIETCQSLFLDSLSSCDEMVEKDEGGRDTD